jgi:hypothetical protein
MKKLELEYKKNGFTYQQVFRDDVTAIYSQSDEEGVIAYEVFKINKNEEREIFGKVFPASESVPPTTQWGNNAYTVHTLEKAFEKQAAILSLIELQIVQECDATNDEQRTKS